MFRGAWFYIHDSVLSADDVSAQLQDHGGRICLSYKKADVVLVDRARSASVASLVAQQAEVVDSSWVGLCLKHGRRLPYTYQAIGAREPEAQPITINNGEVAVKMIQPLPPPGTIPLPGIEVVSIITSRGQITTHTPALKAYFVQFMIALWTMDPSRTMSKLTKNISQILPGLSEWSLHTFAKRNRKQVEYARAQAASARTVGALAPTKDFIDNEIRKTSKVLATLYPSLYSSEARKTSPKVKISKVKIKVAINCNKPPPAQGSRASSLEIHPLRGTPIAIPSPAASNKPRSYMRIGNSSVESLLATPGLPELPTSTSSDARNAFYDDVLRWVLEREPNATKRSICDLVHAMGRRGNITFPERAFESSYRSDERKYRYKEIRESVQRRWCKGGLGETTRPPTEALAWKQQVNRGARSLDSADSHSEVIDVDAIQNNGRPSHTRVSSGSSAQSPVELDAEDDELMQDIDLNTDATAQVILSPSATNSSSELNLKANIRLPVPSPVDGHEILELKRESTKAPTVAKNTGPSLQPKASLMSREQLHALALGHIWFEDFAAAELNLSAGTDPDDYEVQRAPIWKDMVQKFGHDEQHWKTLSESELNQREVETKVKQLRGRTTTYHYYH